MPFDAMLCRCLAQSSSSLEPRAIRGHNPRKLSGEHELALAAHMRSRPGVTLVQAQAWLLSEHGVQLSTGATWNAVHRLGLSFKKALRAAEQDRPDVAARRKLWRAAQPFIDPESLVFLDETGVNTKMARLYGWAPVGERCHDSVPFGHWKTMTFIAGLRLGGMTAPWVLDGAMDGDAFRVYVRDVLAPTLRRGDVVVLDNLPAHKVTGIRETIAERHAQLYYLPPYSPDMNPIEMAFAKLKALLRQQPARTIDGRIERIGTLLDRFLPAECANFFQATGYQRST